MDSETENRVLLALDVMARNDWGVERAAKYAKTTRRTIRRYADKNNIDLKFQKGKALVLKRKPSDKTEDFLTEIHNGLSATAAAKKLHTTVPTMAKQEIGGVPIMSKDGNRWVINFVPVKEYSIVYYGGLIGFNDAVQGRGELSGPDATKPKNKKKQDEDYADIWFQIDVEGLKSTLPVEMVEMAYKKEVMEAARKALESLGSKGVNNAALTLRFKQNASVEADMITKGRDTSNKVSVLENMTRRYDIHMDEPTSGIDERYDPTGKVQFVPVKGFRKKGKKEKTEGKFQLFYQKKDNLKKYGPIQIKIPYQLE